ncbi:MAG TPA: aminoacyl-tRNA hydrolase [Roseiflexaceae bacterium]
MKQVIVVNQSLRLSVGKLAAQVAHAAVGAFLAADGRVQATWLREGMPKIVVYGADADFLLQLDAAARARDVPSCVVHDAGRTVVAAGTVTCVGLGPAGEDALDPLTGALKLV